MKPTFNRVKYWYDPKKKKPKLGQFVIIFDGKHQWNAVYVKNMQDKRYNEYVSKVDYLAGVVHPWVYEKVTHWMPEPPNPDD
jgi:hypothetical protein